MLWEQRTCSPWSASASSNPMVRRLMMSFKELGARCVRRRTHSVARDLLRPTNIVAGSAGLRLLSCTPSPGAVSWSDSILTRLLNAIVMRSCHGACRAGVGLGFRVGTRTASANSWPSSSARARTGTEAAVRWNRDGGCSRVGTAIRFGLGFGLGLVSESVSYLLIRIALQE